MYPFIRKLTRFKKALSITVWICILCCGLYNNANAQLACGFDPATGCGSTDYSNYGINSSDAATLEYDNFVSAYHSTVVRTHEGKFFTWGEFANPGMNSTGTSNADLLSPLELKYGTVGGLSATSRVLKVGIGSNGTPGSDGHLRPAQSVLLATDGLYTWGVKDAVISKDIYNTDVAGKITVNGKTDGLPAGVTPKDVKMMFVTYKAIVITTCSGDVYTLAFEDNVRGAGGAGDENHWSQVIKTDDTPLTGIVATRGSNGAMIALSSSGQLYTWGEDTYLGGGAARADRNKATLMTLPKPGGTIKMIGAQYGGTHINGVSSLKRPSYYVLYSDGSLYALGYNNHKQLGDWTTNERTEWIQPRYNSSTGPVMNDIKWISPTEHDGYGHEGMGVINNNLTVLTWGDTDEGYLGRNQTSGYIDPGIVSGLTASDKVQTLEVGGHTVIITYKCQSKFGYVGHRVDGSMGDGSSGSAYESSITFNTATVDFQVCGATTLPVIETNGSAIFTPDGNYATNQTIQLSLQPSGGVVSILGGPGTLDEATQQLTFLSTPGTIKVQYVADNGCGTTTVVREFITEANTSLNVNFKNLSAIFRGKDLVVNWSTAQEKDNDYFLVEASVDGRKWNAISDRISTKAKDGTSDMQLDYSYTKTGNILASLILPVLALCFVGSKNNKKRNLFLLIVFIVTAVSFYACNKVDKRVSPDDKNIFVRIKQVDVDGSALYSNAVKSVKE